MTKNSEQIIELQGPVQIETIQIPIADEELSLNTKEGIEEIIEVQSSIIDLKQERLKEKLYVKGIQRIAVIYRCASEQNMYGCAFDDCGFECYVDVLGDTIEPATIRAVVASSEVIKDELNRLYYNGSVLVQIKRHAQILLPVIEIDFEAPEIKQGNISASAEAFNNNGSIIVRDGIELPDDIVPVGTIIKTEMRADISQVQAGEGKVFFEGDLTLRVVYLGQEATDGMLQYYENAQIPFSSFIKVPECREESEIFAVVEGRDYLIEPRPDFRGDNRYIQFQFELTAEIEGIRTINAPIVEDFYDLKQVEIDAQIRQFHFVREKKRAKCIRSCTHSIELNDVSAPIARVLYMNVTPASGVLDEQAAVYTLQQNLAVQLTYVDEAGALRSVQAAITQEVVADEPADAQTYVTVDVTASHLEHTLKKNNHVEFTFDLICDYEAYYEGTAQAAVGYKEEPYCTPEPGLYICFSKETENLWEIAKQYRVREADVRAIPSENTSLGRILVFKRMYA